MGTTVIAGALVLGSFPAWPQAPSRPLQPPARPPLRRAAQTPSDQNQLDGNPALFTVLAAINAAGYDDQIDSPSTNAFRHTLRTKLATQSLNSVYELKRFYRDHALKDPKAELNRYISYALLINGPPDFGYRDPDMVRPADASSLEGLSPLLAAFYQEAKLEDWWQLAQPAYDQVIGQYHEPVARAILGVNGYLRNTTNGYLGRRFQIYVDLLGAPNQVQTRSYADDMFVVVTPSEQPQIDGIRHAYLHYLIDPLGFKFAEEIQKKRALGEFAQAANVLPDFYKSDFVLLATECVIKAVESRMDRKPELADQAMREGYVLTAALAEQLAGYEKQEVALRLYFPSLFSGMDLKREQKRMQEVEFALAPATRVIRPAQKQSAPPELTGAEKTLADADKFYTDRNLDQARAAFLRVLDETSQKPLQAKAYYGLARVAVLQRDPETGDNLFRKVLDLDPDADTKSWSLLYLGRLADSQGDRPQAVERYNAALAVEGAPDAVRQAAQKGLEATFTRDSGK